MEKYLDLKKEIRRLWKLRWMEKLGITCNVGVMQKSALLGTARILRKLLEM